MEDLWIVKEFEKVAELMPEKALRLIKKDPDLLKDGVTREELIEEFKKLGIPIRTPDREDVLSEVEVITCL